MEDLFNLNIKHIRNATLIDRDLSTQLLRESVHDFFMHKILPDLHNKTVLEVGPAFTVHGVGTKGAYDFNTKELLLKQGNEYISCDINPNSGADIISDIIYIRNYLDSNSVDAIIALELLEHVAQVWKVPPAFWEILKPHGKIYVSSPYYFIYHDPKPDYWRISQDGYQLLFGNLFKIDLVKVIVEPDGDRPIHMRMIGEKR